MAENDKTSWLEGLEHDEDANPDEGGFIDPVTKTPGSGGFSDQKTELVERRGFEDSRTRLALEGLGSEAPDAVRDPVTAFLVVVSGPGTGRFVPLGAGLNSIGRAEDERVALPFGDTMISGRDHVRILYDDEARVFLIVPGSGKNLTRVNGQVVAMPMPLQHHATIQLSKTTSARFVAFCGAEFDWSDVTDGGATSL